MADSSNVSTGKPRVGGAIYRGATTATLPTDASTDLADDFKSLGYISDEGLKNNNSMTSQDIKAWGGAVVDSAETEKPDTFTFVMLETTLDEVKKAVYGDSNVTGDLSTGRTTHANSTEQEYKSWVADMIVKNTTLRRIVVPKAKVTSINEITYSDSTAVGYGVTITAVPDENGDTHIEYEKTK